MAEYADGSAPATAAEQRKRPRRDHRRGRCVVVL